MVGIRSPDGLVVGSCTSNPEVLGSIPEREEPGKTGAPCLHGQPPGYVEGELVIEVPEEAQGSLLTVPGKGFAWLAASVVRAHFGPNERRRLRTARAWVRLRELARKAASLRFDCIGSALWLQALNSRRRREAGDAPAIMVRLTHPEVMGNEWGVDIAVFQSETASSVKACALGMLACGVLIPGARARRWTSARVRREAIAGHKMIQVHGGWPRRGSGPLAHAGAERHRGGRDARAQVDGPARRHAHFLPSNKLSRIRRQQRRARTDCRSAARCRSAAKRQFGDGDSAHSNRDFERHRGGRDARAQVNGPARQHAHRLPT